MKTQSLLVSLALGIGLALVVYWVTSTPAFAATIVVTTSADNDAADGECSLREAIIAANSDAAYNGCGPGSGDDVIDMTGISGTITLVSHLPIITETVQLNGPATDGLTIDGLDTYNAIDTTGMGVDIGVDHLTVTNVISDGIYATGSITVTNSAILAGGCGIYAEDGGAFVSSSLVSGTVCGGVDVWTAVIITGSTVRGGPYGVATAGHISVTNSSVLGEDGVYSDGGDAFVSHSAITGTLYDGIAVFGDVVARDTTITAGADGVYADAGGAEVVGCTITAGEDGVDVLANVILTSTTITATNNGVFAFLGNAEVTNSTITSLGDDGVDADVGDIKVTASTVYGDESGVDTDTGDVAVTSSRVIGNEDGINAMGNVTVTYSTVTGNSLAGIHSGGNATVSYSTIVDSGGDGISALTVSVFQSTISGNGGDGVQSSNQTSVTIDHSTIVGNVGYGINNAGGTTVVSRTIIAQNGGVGSTRDVNATLSASSSYNLIGNGDGSGAAGGVNGNQVGTTGALLDPQLELLADNGGGTKTRALLPSSSAIDAIPTGSCTASVDQRGVTRPQGSGCDIGAYEHDIFYYLPLVMRDSGG
jgi:CSLREA domain-containing protein